MFRCSKRTLFVAGAVVALAMVLLGGAALAAQAGEEDPRAPGSTSPHARTPEEIYRAQVPTAAPERGAPEGDYQWTPLGGPIGPGGQVNALADHPTTAGRLFAAVAPQGAYDSGPSTIYRTTDGAASWTPLYEAEHQVYSLAAAGSRIYAGAFNPGGEGFSAYVSLDNGATWTPSLWIADRGALIDIATHPTYPELAIAGGWLRTEGGPDHAMVYGTLDSGLSWATLLDVALPDTNARATAVLWSPHDPSLLLAAVVGDSGDTVLYRSTDSGANWSPAFTLAGTQVVSLVAHAVEANVIYAGTSDSTFTWGPQQVYRSADAGLTWDLVLDGNGGWLAFEAPHTLYAARTGLWVSTADGDPGTWTQRSGVPDWAWSFAADPGVSPAALYSGSWAQGVWKSEDGGYGWELRRDGMESPVRPVDLEADPQDPAKLFAAAEVSGGFRTLDRGQTWQPLPSLIPPTFSIAVKAQDPSVVYGSSSSCHRGTVFRSDDGGLTFTDIYTPAFLVGDCSLGNERIAALAVAPSDGDTVYAVGSFEINSGGWQAVVVRSEDDALSWTEVLTLPTGSDFQAVAIDPADAQRVYAGGVDCTAGCKGVLYRTTDGGDSWDLVLETSETITSIVVDYENPQAVYVADRKYDVRKSEDGGDNWALIRSNGPPFYAASGWQLALDPHDHNRVYLGGWGYIAESPDGGATWSEWDAPINQGTPQMEPASLAVDVDTPVQTLYAGFTGVWAHTRPAPASGDRYVATTGDDYMNTCTYPPNPCLTVEYALSLANPGETIRVAGGMYLENLRVGKQIAIEGGYSGPPLWTRDLTAYETVLDGSGSPTIPGDWDGDRVRYPMVIEDGGTYKMWYQGCDMTGACRIGYATSPDGLSWTKHPGNPVLDLGGPGAWDGGSLEAPYVIKEGPNSYKMWYSGFGGCAIGLATSPDGISWTRAGSDPVLTPGGEPWNNNCVLHPSVLYEGGVYKMWLLTLGDDGSGQQPYLAYATSPDGIAWTWDAANPLFARDWEQWFWRPFVLPSGGGYHMWYSVSADGGFTSYAASPDGLAWTKHGAPVLAGTPGEWDDGFAADPTLLFEGGQYRLWYDNGNRIGTATAPDPFDWTKFAGNPILQPGWFGQWGAQVVFLDGASSGTLLDGLTITGGETCGGAGVRIHGVGVTLARLNVHDNNSLNCGGGGVEISDPGSSATIVDSQIHNNTAQDGGGLNMYDGASVTIQNSAVEGNVSNYAGGLHVQGGCTLVMDNCVVSGNTTEGEGGGIRVDNGAVATISATQVRGNVARSWGGGLRADGASLTLANVTLNGNRSLEGEGGGLALWSGTTAGLTNVVVENNTSETNGAGGINVGEWSTLTLENVQIRGNSARWSTGLRLHRSTVTGNRVWIQNNLSTDQNFAGFQLGDQSTLALTNALITGNDGGAGAAWDHSTLELTNVTVADNSRGDGWGGIYVSSDSSAALRNSILAWNGQADLQCDDPGTCSVEYSDLLYAWPGPGNLSTNPRFVDRAAGDYHLAGGSPCIEAANSAYAPGNDLDGDARPYDGDGDGTALPDMGADEYTGPPMPIQPLTDLYVDGSVGPGGSGTPEDPFATLKEAIGVAFPGNTVHVADGTYVENTPIALNLNVLGGYSGLPDWVRDPLTYVTVLDGSGNPTIPGDWDGQGFGMPYVVWDANALEYKMYYSGSGLDGRWTIGLATSPDGVAWTKYPGNPILKPDDWTWEGTAVSEPFVRIEGPGVYKMWYDNMTSVGYATSADGISWTKHPAPVFDPNPGPGAWDSWSVRAPSVIKPGADYLLYYTGSDGSGVWWMGFATSPDGLTWTRHGDPVLAPGAPGDWDGLRIYRPDVTYAGGLYHAFYVGISQQNVWRLGVATSPDGIAWTKHAGNPVLPGDEPWENLTGWGAGHFLDGALWKVWYAGIGDLGTGFGLATSDDGLEWTPDDAHNPLLEPGVPGQNGAPTVHIYTPWKAQVATMPALLARLESATRARPEQEQAHVVLDGLTVTGGTYWQGAGVRIENAEATLQNVRVVGNQALGDGGGVGVYGGSTVEVLASQILSNTAQSWGGGLQAGDGSQVTMAGVKVLWNHAVTGEGGGLVFYGEGTAATLIGVAVVENQADGGGGISQTGEPGSLLVMERVEVSHNVARWAAGLRPYHSTVVGDRVWIMDNVATDEGCGGFNADSSEVTLTNALIAGNAGNAGCAWGGSLALTNVTVAGNSHSSGWGGLGVGGAGVATVRNSILYFNGDGDLGCDVDSTCSVEYSDVEHAWPGTGNISQDPLFGTDYHITYASPARDAGTDVGAPDHDIDGEPRPFVPFEPAVPAFDMGADEWWPAPDLIAVAVSPQQQSGMPGQEVVYQFSVTNSGNYADVYSLTVSGFNWPTELSADSTAKLEPGEAELFQVTVQVPAFGVAYVWGSDTFNLSVASSWPPHPVAVLPGTTTAEADLGVTLTPPTSSGEGMRGEVVQYELTVTNAGEYVDDYTLALTSAWAASLSTLTIDNLAAGASVHITLSVTVPDDAGAGDLDTATVTVQSDTDPLSRAQAAATTTAKGSVVYLPLVVRQVP